MSRDAAVWVLEYLLDSEEFDDDFVKQYFDGKAKILGAPESGTYARLLLRILKNQAQSESGLELALGTLTRLQGAVEALKSDTLDASRFNELVPSTELLVEVRTFLCLLGAKDKEQAEDPSGLLEEFFPSPEDGELEGLEAERKDELEAALKDRRKLRGFQSRHTAESIRTAIESFIAAAKPTLGINKIERLAAVSNRAEGLNLSPASPSRGRRGRRPGQRTSRVTRTEQDAADIIANMNRPLAMLAAAGGTDPLPDSMQRAQAAEGGHGNQGGDDEAKDGHGMSPPEQLPERDSDFDMNTEARGRAKRELNSPKKTRRNVGRWTEKETSTLIRLVREMHKGHWAEIHEAGGDVLRNRTQAALRFEEVDPLTMCLEGLSASRSALQCKRVDLKDKWRNLERHGGLDGFEGHLDRVRTGHANPVPLAETNAENMQIVVQDEDMR